MFELLRVIDSFPCDRFSSDMYLIFTYEAHSPEGSQFALRARSLQLALQSSDEHVRPLLALVRL